MLLIEAAMANPAVSTFCGSPNAPKRYCRRTGVPSWIDRGEFVFEPRRYLALLEQKPGALDQAAPCRAGYCRSLFNICGGRGKEGFRMRDALHGVAARFGLRVIMLRQAVDLVDIENRVTLHERDGAFACFTGCLVGFGAGDFVGIDETAPLFAILRENFGI